jgi:hypothetical protein
VFKHFILILAQKYKSLVPKYGYEVLLDDTYIDEEYPQVNEYKKEVLHFFDELISDWTDYNLNKKHASVFVDALKNADKNSYIYNYIKVRLTNLAWMKLHYCKSKNGISRLPSTILQQIQQQNSLTPSLLDWITITSSKENYQDSLVRLSEFEALILIKLVINLINKGLLFNKEQGNDDSSNEDPNKQKLINSSYPRIRKIGLSVNDWQNLRKLSINEHHELEDKLSIQVLIDEIEDPDLMYLERIKDYVSQIVDTAEANQFITCFSLTLLLVQLLSNSRITTKSFELNKLLKWKSPQYVIKNCDVPSTDVISLITSTINHFYLIYKELYKSLSNAKIPYRPWISESIDLETYKQNIERIVQESSQKYIFNENGILELRIENMDQMLEE